MDGGSLSGVIAPRDVDEPLSDAWSHRAVPSRAAAWPLRRMPGFRDAVRVGLTGGRLGCQGEPIVQSFAARMLACHLACAGYSVHV